MRRPALLGAVISLISVLGAALSATAADVVLWAATLTDARSAVLPFSGTEKAPAGASMEAAAVSGEGEVKVRLSFKKMEPAILFGGNISAYVLWGVTREGVIENLGEVFVSARNASDTLEYSTGQRAFALMVTAEPFSLIKRPSRLVLFTSVAPDAKKIKSEKFVFSKFEDWARAGAEKISDVAFDGRTPIPILQAERVYETADKARADVVAPNSMRDAKIALDQARNQFKGSGNSNLVTDYARRSIALSAEALRDLYRGRDARLAAEAESKRLADKVAVDTLVAAADAKSKGTLATLPEIERERASLAIAASELERQRATLAEQRQKLQTERSEHAAQLSVALRAIAETREGPGGPILVFPETAFEPNKPALKAATQRTLTKLAGLMLGFPGAKMHVESYPGSTAKSGVILSEARSKSVFSFLESQGVAKERISIEAMANAGEKADGKTLDRRVEITVTSPIPPAPMAPGAAKLSAAPAPTK